MGSPCSLLFPQCSLPSTPEMRHGPGVLSPVVVGERCLLRSFFPPTLCACVGLDGSARPSSG